MQRVDQLAGRLRVLAAGNLSMREAEARLIVSGDDDATNTNDDQQHPQYHQQNEQLTRGRDAAASHGDEAQQPRTASRRGGNAVGTRRATKEPQHASVGGDGDKLQRPHRAAGARRPTGMRRDVHSIAAAVGVNRYATGVVRTPIPQQQPPYASQYPSHGAAGSSARPTPRHRPAQLSGVGGAADSPMPFGFSRSPLPDAVASSSWRHGGASVTPGGGHGGYHQHQHHPHHHQQYLLPNPYQRPSSGATRHTPLLPPGVAAAAAGTTGKLLRPVPIHLDPVLDQHHVFEDEDDERAQVWQAHLAASTSQVVVPTPPPAVSGPEFVDGGERRAARRSPLETGADYPPPPQPPSSHQRQRGHATREPSPPMPQHMPADPSAGPSSRAGGRHTKQAAAGDDAEDQHYPYHHDAPNHTRDATSPSPGGGAAAAAKRSVRVDETIDDVARRGASPPAAPQRRKKRKVWVVRRVITVPGVILRQQPHRCLHSTRLGVRSHCPACNGAIDPLHVVYSQASGIGVGLGQRVRLRNPVMEPDYLPDDEPAHDVMVG